MWAGCTAAAVCIAGVLATSASAAMTVCSSGCAYTGIQAAINGSAPGATITIAKGSYFENVTVNKSVTLKGAGAETIVYPGSSNPVCSPGSLCGGSASNIFLVQADNVTIESMQLRGDNPNLNSGVVVGGEDIDARNGIITNHEAGTFNGLNVTKVKITGIYLRGIYASSGGTFSFTHDTITNVQGEGASIAMFNFGGSGVMAYNKVTSANDAISANWSTGTQFIHNVVAKSGSGVHTDNNGGDGGSADVIKENRIHECSTNGYGIFVFVPYLSATVEGNRVSGCYVGLAAYGSAVSGQGPSFVGNVLNGLGATTTDTEGTYGAYITTDELGFGFGDVTATLSSNKIARFTTGLLVTQTRPSPEQPAGGQASVTAESNNSFIGNTHGANGEPGTVLNAANDWWGCSRGPNMGGMCNTALGTTTFTPWLTAAP
jgi:hypothetical protein